MFKKFLIVLLLFALVACTSKIDIVEKEYIDPAMDIFLFDEISEDNQKIIKKANGNKEYKNYQFQMLGIDAYDKNLVDINGNTLNLKDYEKVVIEVVSIGCEHCKKMVANYNDVLLNKGIKIIQYFNVGSYQDILDLYKDIDLTIPDNLTIIIKDKEFEDYLKNTLKLEYYPSLISFMNDKIVFNEYGDIEEDELDAYFDISFNNSISNKIDIAELCKKYRSVDDVKESFSKVNLNRIEELDNDGNTLEYTLKLIGTKLDFDKISNDISSVYINEIESYEEYKNSDLVLIYTYLSSTQEEYKINFINKLIDSNDNVKYIVVLIEGMDSSSNTYKNMSTKFHTKVVSVLGYIPDDFFKIGLKKYPTAFFIEKGTFTGVYSNIDNIENFNKAINMFIGDESIALKTNN